MVSTTLDPTQYKNEQRRGWDAVAPGWRTWWSIIERGAQALSDHMVLLAQVETGHSVLDVATGYGEPAITAAQRVGSSGRVIGVDISPRMLDVARDRARAHGLQHVDFHEMDVEDLSLPEGSFDAALCRLGLMYFPNPTAALVNIKQQLRVGGRLVAAVWGPPEESPAEGLPEDIASKQLHRPVAQPGVPGPFSLSDARTTEQKFIQAGFTEVHSEIITYTYEFASLDDFIRYSQEAVESLRVTISKLSPAQQEKTWDRIREQTKQLFLSADGKVRMPAEVICVVGRR